LHFTAVSDAAAGTWSEELCSALEIDRQRLPRIVEPWTVIGELSPEAARDFGLKAGVPVKAIRIPLLIITSEFGTVSMWDWEIAAYMRSEGIASLAPSSLEQARKICRALGVKRQLRKSKFLVFQGNPGAGFQASIFKRFYWWEDECTQRICDKFGIEIVRKSFGSSANPPKRSETRKPRLSPMRGMFRCKECRCAGI